jgi:LAO/AO transport system kinase
VRPVGEGETRPAPRRPSRTTDGAAVGRRLREGDLSAAAAALNLLESRTEEAREQAGALAQELSPRALGHEPRGHIVGLTGPPGAGKSTLLAALVRRLGSPAAAGGARPGLADGPPPAGSSGHGEAGRSVAVLAVDPSSRRSGGALLGDRLRIELDAPDERVFIRSSASGERHGGLAGATRVSAEALAAAFDLVVIETVGVGQAETEVEEVADTVIVVVQPGAGDVLQFLKAGIMEIPDVLVVTKADLGEIAERTASELRTAVGSLGAEGPGGGPPVVKVSSLDPVTGIDELAGVLEQRREELLADGQRRLRERRVRARRAGAITDFALEHGQRALRALGGRRGAERLLGEQDPALSARELSDVLASGAHAAGGTSSA